MATGALITRSGLGQVACPPLRTPSEWTSLGAGGNAARLAAAVCTKRSRDAVVAADTAAYCDEAADGVAGEPSAGGAAARGGKKASIGAEQSAGRPFRSAVADEAAARSSGVTTVGQPPTSAPCTSLDTGSSYTTPTPRRSSRATTPRVPLPSDPPTTRTFKPEASVVDVVRRHGWSVVVVDVSIDAG